MSGRGMNDGRGCGSDGYGPGGKGRGRGCVGRGRGDVSQSEPPVRRGRGRPPGRGRRGVNVGQRDVNVSHDSQAEAAASKRLRTEDANFSDNNVADLQLHQPEHSNAGSSVIDNGPQPGCSHWPDRTPYFLMEETDHQLHQELEIISYIKSWRNEYGSAVRGGRRK